ncbi:MAG: ATP-binding protein [Desulfovibrionaceae bacterium]
MNGTTRHPFRKSIAGRLVLVLIAVYALITVVLTALQMGMEFYSTKRSVLAELENMGQAVSPGLAAAIYNVDDEQVGAILSGVAASASILSVRVERQYQPAITLGHMPSFQGLEADRTLSEDTGFSRTVTLPYRQLDGSTVNVGALTLQSSADIVFGKVRSGMFPILAASAVKLLCVCVVILLLSRRMVSRPLDELTSAVTKVSLDTLASEQVDIHARGLSELRTLQDAFNAMLRRLGEHRAARKEAEDRYRGFYQNAVEGIFQTTPEGRFVSANPALAAMLGYESPEELYHAVHDLGRQVYVYANDRRRLLDHMRRGEILTGFEAQVYRKDRSIMWVSFYCRPVFDQNGHLRFVEGMSTDITERKQAETAMRQAMEAAEDASRMKSDFISMVSHELRTPLTSVLGFAMMIRKKFLSEIQPQLPQDDPATARVVEQVSENLSVIIHEGKRLSLLISEVLDLSRMESGTVELQKKTVDISRIVDRAAASVGVLLEEKGLGFTKIEEPDLPLVEADEDRIIQVCINLLANAVKFTPSGGITCRLNRTETHIRVSVEDTGPGIPPKDQEDIFNKFKQLGDTLTDRPQGTGLGLAICKEIVEQHGGHIWVESSPGVGSSFVFLLPLPPAGRHSTDKGEPPAPTIPTA